MGLEEVAVSVPHRLACRIRGGMGQVNELYFQGSSGLNTLHEWHREDTAISVHRLTDSSKNISWLINHCDLFHLFILT